MAKLVLTPSDGGFTWQITELGNAFKEAYYAVAAITDVPFEEESDYFNPNLIISSVYPAANRTQKTTPKRPVRYPPGSYTFWAWAKAQNGIYYPAGSAEVEVPDLSSTRPDDWEWWNTIQSGKPIQLEAAEWNAFCERINEFRVWFGVNEYDFTVVESGDPIKADIVNEARIAILTMTADIPRAVERGDPITAQFFLDLQDALNSVE